MDGRHNGINDYGSAVAGTVLVIVPGLENNGIFTVRDPAPLFILSVPNNMGGNLNLSFLGKNLGNKLAHIERTDLQPLQTLENTNRLPLIIDHGNSPAVHHGIVLDLEHEPDFILSPVIVGRKMRNMRSNIDGRTLAVVMTPGNSEIEKMRILLFPVKFLRTRA